MRRQVLSKSKNRSIRVHRDISEPYILKPKRDMVMNKERLMGHLHIRSKTRLFQEDAKDKIYGYSQTPATFLPNIYQNKVSLNQNQQRNEMDSLQTYVHRLLLKNLKQYKLHKEVRSVEEQLDKKKLNMIQKQQQTKKQKEKTKLQQLKLKLNELYGQLQVEKKQLEIEYHVQTKMQNKYNNFYDKIARRFKNTTVDTAQNTQQPAVSNTQTNEAKPKLRVKSKFRAAAMAVYFTIVFPKYCKLFNLVRKNDHQQRIVKSNGIKNSMQQCYKLFEMMKLKVFWIQLEYKNKQITNEAVVVTLRRKTREDSYTFKVQNVTTLLKYLLGTILTTVKEGKIDELIKAMSLTVTNRSFLTPNLFLKQQLQQLYINQNLTLNVSAAEERKLIVDLVLSKLTGFGFMISHRYSKTKNKYIMNPQPHNNFQNLSSSISQQLLLGGLYLMQLCNKVNEQRPKETIGIEGKKCSGMVEAMADLQTKEEIVVKSEFKKKRSSIQSSVAQNQRIQVKNITKLSDLIDIFDQNNAQPEILKLIKQLQDQIYNRCIGFKKQFYQLYKNKTLDQFKQLQQQMQHLQTGDSQKQKFENNFILEQINEQAQISQQSNKKDVSMDEDVNLSQEQIEQQASKSKIQ